MKATVKILIKFFLLFFSSCIIHAQKQSFNSGWEFIKDRDVAFGEHLLKKNNAGQWLNISLPHTVNIEPIEKTPQQWQGISFYNKFFAVPVSDKGKHIAIDFEGAMQEADVYLNGQHVFKHLGGYLPFYIDVSNGVKFGTENSIVVQLDNRDNPLIPPGEGRGGGRAI